MAAAPAPRPTRHSCPTATAAPRRGVDGHQHRAHPWVVEVVRRGQRVGVAGGLRIEPALVDDSGITDPGGVDPIPGEFAAHSAQPASASHNAAVSPAGNCPSPGRTNCPHPRPVGSPRPGRADRTQRGEEALWPCMEITALADPVEGLQHPAEGDENDDPARTARASQTSRGPAMCCRAPRQQHHTESVSSSAGIHSTHTAWRSSPGR